MLLNAVGQKALKSESAKCQPAFICLVGLYFTIFYTSEKKEKGNVASFNSVYVS